MLEGVTLKSDQLVSLDMRTCKKLEFDCAYAFAEFDICTVDSFLIMWKH